jgi:hypothetical protein
MKNKCIALLICSLVSFSVSSCVLPDSGLSTYSSSSYSVLPTGYRTVYVGGDPYYHSRDSWYRRGNDRYISCPRPHGYSGSIGSSYNGRYGNNYGLVQLPSGYSTVSFGGQTFYNNGSSWYNRNGGRYHQCSAPRGYYNHHSNRGSSYNPRNHSSHHNSNHSSYSHQSTRSTRSDHPRHSSDRSSSNSPSRSSVYKGDLKRAARD